MVGDGLRKEVRVSEPIAALGRTPRSMCLPQGTIGDKRNSLTARDRTICTVGQEQDDSEATNRQDA